MSVYGCRNLVISLLHLLRHRVQRRHQHKQVYNNNNNNNNNNHFTQGPLRLSADEGIHSARASSPTLWGDCTISRASCSPHTQLSRPMS